jgi:hypothetical protein
MDAEHETIACQRFFNSLTELCVVRSIKLYRFKLEPVPRVPVLPCLDHEVMLHEGIPRHASAYVEERSSHDMHEVLFVPADSLIEFDVVSTSEEHSQRSRERLMAQLKERFPHCTVRTNKPSYVRGDKRVMQACRAQVSLREILQSDDFDRLEGALERIKTIAELMEKESRVASWAVRTVTTPLLAAIGFLVFALIGGMGDLLGGFTVRSTQAIIVGALGGVCLYYGIKAVHLAEMSTRLWKRSAEYHLIVSERRQIGQKSHGFDTSVGGAVPAGIIRTDRS